MTRPRFSVVHGVRFEELLTRLWLSDPKIQQAMDDLEPVLRSIPEQAGNVFWYHGREYWSMVHRQYLIIYIISIDDCAVRLIDIRKLT